MNGAEAERGHLACGCSGEEIGNMILYRPCRDASNEHLIDVGGMLSILVLGRGHAFAWDLGDGWFGLEHPCGCTISCKGNGRLDVCPCAKRGHRKEMERRARVLPVGPRDRLGLHVAVAES